MNVQDLTLVSVSENTPVYSDTRASAIRVITALNSTSFAKFLDQNLI